MAKIQGYEDHVPSWSGDASEFESYVTACKWYAKATKESERGLVVARLWGRLRGAAKSVVRHLDPDSFEGDGGLLRFLAVLRESPLQQLPIPDSFSRLEKWNHLRRFDRETISELLVREEELFTDLQQALERARQDRRKTKVRIDTEEPSAGDRTDAASRRDEQTRGPPSTPSRSPMNVRETTETATPPSTAPQLPPRAFVVPERTDFFSDELRGYRLLKSARLTSSERQNVLVQTANSTEFLAIRRALRTLFSEDPERSPMRQGNRVWWNETDVLDEEEAVHWNEWSPQSWDSASWTGVHDHYWNDWHTDDWWNDDWDESQYDVNWNDDDEMIPDDAADGPEEAHFKEAYNIAGEANKTLREAKEAVRRVRQARGYYAPESSTGKGMSFQSAAKSHGKGKGGAGKSGKGFGPCFICGKPDHGYRQCPDRFAKGKGQKGLKGKPKGKGKGKVMYHDIHLDIFSALWDAVTSKERLANWALLDTGATENAVGSEALDGLISQGSYGFSVVTDDRPVFRFGNGLKDQAVSRVDLHDTSLGPLSFYVLGGTGRTTPPLIGARTLRSKQVMISYADGVFMYRNNPVEPTSQCTVTLHPMQSGHMAIDLAEIPAKLDPNTSTKAVSDGQESHVVELVNPSQGSREEAINALWTCHTEPHDVGWDDVPSYDMAVLMASTETNLGDRLQALAHQLQDLRNRSQQSNELGTGSPRRSTSQGMAMSVTAQGGSEEIQPICQLDSMQPMRSPSQLPEQERLCGTVEADGPRPSCGPHRHGRAGDDDGSGCMFGEGGKWKDHGGEGQDVATGHRPVTGHSSHPVRVPGEVGEGHQKCQVTSEVRESSIHISNHASSPSSRADEPSHDVGGGERRVEETSAAGGGCGQDNAGLGPSVAEAEGKGGACSEDREGCHQGQGAQVQGINDTSSCSVIPNIGGNGDDSSGHRFGEGGLSLLKSALGSLKERMHRAASPTNTTSHPPNTPDGNTSTTIQHKDAEDIFSRSPSSLLRSSMATAVAGEAPAPLMAVSCSCRGMCSTSDPMSTSLSRPTAAADGNITGTSMTLTSTSPTRHGVPEKSKVPVVPNAEKKKSGSKMDSGKNIVPGQTAHKVSTGLAALGAMVLLPMHGLLTQIACATDFMEIACSPESSLSQAMIDRGFEAKRVNFREGYDLETPKGTNLLKNEMAQRPPKFSWVSLPCTRLSSLVNLTERTPEEWARFEQRQNRDLKRADEVGEAIAHSIEKRPDSDFAWEWPTRATKGWQSKAIKKLEKRMKSLGKKVYWCHFHGCAFGLCFNGLPVQKSWTVMTTNRSLWLALQRKCPGHPEHLHCRGHVAQASSYYPKQMVEASVKAIVSSWTQPEENMMVSLARDVEHYLLDLPYDENHPVSHLQDVRDEEPVILGLSRTKFPETPPSGKKLEMIKQQMMRIHRSSGHASFSNLQRLLRARRAPQWSIDLAGSLQCPECVESKRPQPQPPASTKPMADLWEIVGTDVFEFEHDEEKHKFVLWRDRASGYAFVKHLQTYTKAWEPKSKDIIGSLIDWLMVNPCPSWIMSDAGTVYTSEEFLYFAERSGIGILTAPAEAHWMMGPEEGCIGVLKQSAQRILKEESGLTVAQAFALAVHGHNSVIGPSGFSPFQWIRGGSCPQEDLLPGLNPKKVFSGILKLKEMARLAVEKENARYKLSKLGNSVTRPPMAYKTGGLVMLWRQRK